MEIKIKTKFRYDERRKILTAITEKTGDGVNSIYTDDFTADGIKKLYAKLKKDKKEIQEMINKMDTNLSNLEDQKSSLEIPELTEEQKTLMENLKVLQKYEPGDKIDVQTKQLKENQEAIKKELKEKNKVINEIRTKVKFKLE